MIQIVIQVIYLKQILKKKKESYVVHIQALKQALLHGLELKKVYRVISFRQKAQLKAYIEINTKLKNDAKNEFEKDFFKLMNNAVFGKSWINVLNCTEVKLVVTEEEDRKQYQNLILIHAKNFLKILQQLK